MNLQGIKTALSATSEGLDAAGFDLHVEAGEDHLHLRVQAREGACEDCLVPKSMFKQMALDELREGGYSFTDLEIHYPIDARRTGA